MTNADSLEITIIIDNAGATTIQLETLSGERYQTYCMQPQDAARLIKDAETDGTFEGWEGNDLDEGVNWLDPSNDDIASGGYQIFSPDEIRTLPDDSQERGYALKTALADAR